MSALGKTASRSGRSKHAAAATDAPKRRAREQIAGPKPTPLEPRFDSIPPELGALHQWVNWRYAATEKGRWTKEPFQPNGARASSTDPTTWSTLDAVAVAHLGGEFDGVGFVTSEDDPFVLIDLDHVIDVATGEMAPWATEILSAARSECAYIELSPSGDGFHIIGRGEQGFDGRKANAAELYCRARFFTITGHLA